MCLRQLAVAISNYTAQQGVLPPSGITGDSSTQYDPRAGKMFSWVILILPNIEQQNLQDRFDFDVNVMQQGGNPQDVAPSTLLCPSDAAKGRFYSHASYTSGRRFAKGNYAAFVSPYHVEYQTYYPGVLVGNRSRQPVHIRDGLSNTVMLSEVRTRSHKEDQRGAWALPWPGSTQLAFDMHHHSGDFQERYVHSPGSLGHTQPPNNLGPNVDILFACPDVSGVVPTASRMLDPRLCRRIGTGKRFFHAIVMRNAMERIFLGLGGNVDDRRGFFMRAVEALCGDGIAVVRRSSLYASEPEGPADQEPYLNAAVEAKTSLAPLDLLARVKAIERRLGRVERGRWAEREIDIDILLYGERIIQEKDLSIPHPRLHERRFALRPLAEIAPDAQHPVFQKSVAALLAECADKKRTVRIDAEW